MSTEIMETEALEIETERDLGTYFEAETYSPYALAKVVNKILSDAQIEKQLPPQMFYQYTSKGRIATINDERGSKRQVAREDAIEWTEKYLSKLA